VSGVRILPVRTPAERNRFIDLPQDLYRGEAGFVPPLKMERRAALDPSRHPWFEFGTAELFNAERDGRTVGRVAAFHDRNHNRFHGSTTGHFGMFEVDLEEPPSVTHGLMSAAERWLLARGLDRLEGPVGPSTNYECGLLVKGQQAPASLRTPWNPAGYADRLEQAGLRKARDLFGWELRTDVPEPPRFLRVEAALVKSAGIRVRSFDPSQFDREVAVLRGLYNAAWERNWGFVPMTDAEFRHMASELRPLLEPRMVRIAEVAGEPVAFSLALPDASPALKAAGGRLTTFGLPLGLLRMAWAARKLKRLRLITLGVKERFRRRGLDALLCLDALRGARALGYEAAELSWTLEDNLPINRAISSLGARHTKTWRLYEKELA
jgi:GNAT superfamily N-acetyltransferase